MEEGNIDSIFSCKQSTLILFIVQYYDVYLDAETPFIHESYLL